MEYSLRRAQHDVWDAKMTSFTITHQDRKTKARTAMLKTKKASIETPFFMPVSTKASVKYFTTEDLEKIGIGAIISNTYLLHLRPGEKLIKKFGGIGKFMNFTGINVTDSGGFQMYSDRVYISSNEKGVMFRNPFNSDKIFVSPEKDMEIQIALHSDIAMCLDSMPPVYGERKKIEDSVKKTIMWAARCKKHHDLLQKGRKKEDRQMLFGIVQGGLHRDLRGKCAKELVQMNFDGYSIGGLALGETKEEEYSIIEHTKRFLPGEKPVYLMGAGNPMEVLEAISRGVDMFDSRFPTQNARHGTLFTSKGNVRIKNARYKADRKPIDSECRCFVCMNYSRAYVRYQLMNQESVGMRLCTYHNLTYMNDLLKNARDAIKKGKFDEFLDSQKRAYSKDLKNHRN